MKIGIDARFTLQKTRGIGNYSLKLIEYLAKIDNKNQYFLYVDQDDSTKVLPKKSNFAIKKLQTSNYFIWEQIFLPIQAYKDKIDVLHCVGNTAPACLATSIKLIITIHDVMYLKDYEEVPKSASLYQKLGRIYRKLIVPFVSKQASKVITVSDFSKKDIQLHLPYLKESDVHTIYQSYNEAFAILEPDLVLQKLHDKFDIDADYIMALGAPDLRKNTRRIIEAFSELKLEHCIHPKLVIVGFQNWTSSHLLQYVQSLPCQSDIMFTDYVSLEDLVYLYNGALFLLYPSLYEGFGVPPLEAMANGTPVITSNITSIPEVVGNAALLVNPTSKEQIKTTMLSLLNNQELRGELIARGLKRIQKFSWERMASETLTLYCEVYKPEINN